MLDYLVSKFGAPSSLSLEIFMLISGYVLAGLLSLGIAVVGVRFLLAPEAAAAGYGVALRPEARTRPDLPAFLQTKGVRDIVSGLFIPVLIGFGQPHALAVIMLTTTITPLADAAIVLRHGGSRATAFGIHVATAGVMILDAVLLLLA
jgi:hypothetical protein